MMSWMNHAFFVGYVYFWICRHVRIFEAIRSKNNSQTLITTTWIQISKHNWIVYFITTTNRRHVSDGMTEMITWLEEFLFQCHKIDFKCVNYCYLIINNLVDFIIFCSSDVTVQMNCKTILGKHFFVTKLCLNSELKYLNNYFKSCLILFFKYTSRSDNLKTLGIATDGKIVLKTTKCFWDDSRASFCKLEIS